MAGADIGWASEKQPPICYKYYKYIVSPGRQFYNMCPMLFMYVLMLLAFSHIDPSSAGWVTFLGNAKMLGYNALRK